MTEQTQSGISRRTLARGAAWAAPAVAVAAAAPAYADSVTTTTTTLPPCLAGITNDSIEWAVDNVAYANCNCPSHVDVRLKFNVSSSNCPYERVEVRVRNYGNPSTNHARWCWTGTNGWLTKYAVISGGTVTYPRQRLLTGNTPVVNDALYFPARQTNYSASGTTGWSTDDLGSCNADGYVGTNDGMHINPCSPGPYFEYQVRYMTGGSWGPWGAMQTWGDRTLVPPPAGCGPAPVLTLVSNSCTGNTRTVKVSWTGTANRLRWSDDTTWGDRDDVIITNVSGNTHTYTFTDSNCNSTFYFRVYQNGTTNYSNTLIVTPTTTGSAQARSASGQESQSGSESVSETSTGTEGAGSESSTAEPSATDSSTTEPSTIEPSATDSSTPEPSATETAGDAPSPEPTDQ